jgi:hypothetical protein
MIFLQTQILSLLLGYCFGLLILLLYYDHREDIQYWIEKNFYTYSFVKTDQIITNENFRWQTEKFINLVLGQKPWYKSYIIEKYKKLKFFGKPKLIDIIYEKIPNSDYIIDEWDDPEKIKELKKVLIQLGHVFPS